MGPLPSQAPLPPPGGDEGAFWRGNAPHCENNATFESSGDVRFAPETPRKREAAPKGRFAAPEI